MPLSAPDERTAPIVVDLPAHEHGYDVTLAVDAMTEIRAEAHKNSVERVFPLLGETGTTSKILELLRPTRSGAA